MSTQFKFFLVFLLLIGYQNLHAQKSIENNGLVVMEVETAPLIGAWERRTNISGFSGTAFYYGTVDNFGEGGNHILNYKISVTTPGVYQLNIRSRIASGSSSTDANDQYVRMLDGNSQLLAPVWNDNYATGTWYKFYQNKLSSWAWQTSNKDNHPRSLSWNLTPGDYWIQISMRSNGCAVDKIALWNKARYDYSPETGNPSSGQITSLNSLPTSAIVNDPNPMPTTPSDGPFPHFTGRRFDKTTDILIAQFDNKPDADDIQSQAALGSILAHPSYSDVNYYAVAGAYGTQSGSYINSNSLFTMAFGTQNVKWTDAHNDRTNSINRIIAKVKPVLQAGGMVWVQEAGQSDVTADWVAALISQGIPTATIKSNVVVVQHSKWNENATTTAKLTYIRSMTTYASIDDGNVDFGVYNQERQKRQFPTPGYESLATNWMTEVKSASNHNSKAKQLWTEADRIIVASGFKASYSSIPKGGVDFSDCVENWYILNLGVQGNSIRAFWDNFVVNAPAASNYLLTTNASIGGTVSNGGTYANGSVVSLTATANSGFVFTGWSGDLSGTSNPVSITMNSNKTVTATFAPITYTLSTNATAGGLVSSGGILTIGTVVTITATPNNGFIFTGWSGDLSGSTNPTTITMNSNKTVTANFTPITYTLATSAPPGGSVSPGGTYSSGTVVSLAATPDNGFRFTGWSGDLSGTSNPANIAMNSNKNITANFVAIPNYTLSTNAISGGTVTSGGVYQEGTIISLTATPDNGFRFTGWSGDLSGSQNPSSLTMNSHKTVTANFVAIPNYTLTTNATSGGTVTSGGVYQEGTLIYLTATPDNGFRFTGWSGDLSGAQNPASITMNSNKTVTANFVAIPNYTLSTNATSGGSVTSGGVYEEGRIISLIATPDNGFRFTGWSGDLSGSQNPASITMNSHKTVTANFVAIPNYTLSTNATSGGSVTSGGIYQEGTIISLTATPDNGFRFTGWSSDLSGSQNPSSITMNSDKTVTANFVAIPNYTLSTNTTSGGTVTSGGVYQEGTIISLTATPDNGFRFTGWSGNLSGSQNPASITMNSNKTVTANFAPITYVLTTSATAGGSVTAGGTYSSGSVVSLTATPNSGFIFTGWSGSLSGTTNPINITMNSNKSVTANFSPISAPSVTALTNWVAGTNNPKVNGSNRLMVVMVMGEKTGSGTLSASVTYGGRTMRKQVERNFFSTNTSHASIFTLNEADVNLATNGNISVSWNTLPKGSAIYSVLLANVDQVGTLFSSATNGLNGRTVSTSTSLVTSPGDMVLLNGTTGTSGTVTFDNGFRKMFESNSTFGDGVGGFKIATGANETPKFTQSGSARMVICGLVVKKSNTSVIQDNSLFERSKTEDEIQLFPNPTADKITIRSNESFDREITIINSLGQVVYSINSEESNINIDLKTINSLKGTYYVKISANNYVKTHKILVE